MKKVNKAQRIEQLEQDLWLQIYQVENESLRNRLTMLLKMRIDKIKTIDGRKKSLIKNACKTTVESIERMILQES